MNVTREKTDELNSTVKIKIEKPDYEDRVNNILKDYRRKARIDGFRPGMVPFGLISKMYRKPVLAEEINKILTESISKFIVDEKLHILGEPLPNDEHKPSFDFDRDETFEFVFDIGLAPEVDINVSQKDKFTFYKIKIDEKIRSEYIDNYTSRLGSFKDIEASNDKSMLTVDLVQIDNDGNIVENGINVEDAKISVQSIKDDKLLAPFIGLKTGDEFQANLKKTFPNNTELSGLLKIKKEEVELINGEFKLKVKSISEFVKAEINQEFYDKLFGKDTVKTEEEFTAKLDEIIRSNLDREGDYKLQFDLRDFYVKKFKKDLPEAFLKRWLIEVNKGKYTEDQIEKDFEHFIEDLKWQLIKDKIGKDNDIKVTEEDLLEYAKKYTQMQFAQYYGITDMPDEHLTNYAQEMLKKEEERRNFAEKKFEEKIIEFIRQTAKIEEKEISSEKFNKLLEK